MKEWVYYHSNYFHTSEAELVLFHPLFLFRVVT